MLNLESFTTGTTATAVGALGTASFAIVDGLKTLPVIGLSNSGYAFIQDGLQIFFENQTRRGATGSLKILFDTLHGNWINGRTLEDQKAIAKSLIKLRLDETTASRFADATNVDKAILLDLSKKLSTNDALTPAETNVLGRFDLALSAILDDAYQHADQRYRNWAKLAATFVAMILALAGGYCTRTSGFWGSPEMGLCLLAGLLAAPLAPVSKDLASALQAGVKVAQALRR